MKHTITIILICILGAIAHAARTEFESQRQALKAYPELGVSGSALNKRFLEVREELQKRAPNFFHNPDWPMLLAAALDSQKQSPGFLDDPKWAAKLVDYMLGAPKVVQPTAHFLETKKKAEDGDAAAQLALALLYGDGKEVTADEAEARKWLEASAQNGNLAAQGVLGEFLRDGLHGYAKDPGKAIEWFRKSAGNGNLTAMENLGEFYERSTGVTRDLPEAVKWYRRAAEAGYAPSQLSLASCYLYGQGLPKDLVQAHLWASLAAAMKTGEGLLAQKVVEQCEGQMTPGQIAEAQRLSREFRPRIPEEASNK